MDNLNRQSSSEDKRGQTFSSRTCELLPCLFSMKDSSLCPVLLLSIILAVVLPLITARLILPAFTNIMVESIQEDAQRLAHLALPASLKHTHLKRDRLTERFFGEIYKLEHDFGLMRIKIFSHTGEVLYSTDSREVGAINSHPYFINQVAKGKSVTTRIPKGSRTLENKTSQVDVVETYVPFMKDDQFLGAFEMYYDVTKRMDRMRRLGTYSIVMTALLSAGLALVLALLTRKDVMQQKAQRQTEALKEDVERITRHDLKAPIAGILSGVEFLRRYTSLDEEQTSMLKEMRQAGNTALELINRSLDLYKMETGRYQYTSAPMDMIALSRRVSRDLSGLAASRGVRVLLTREGKEPREGETLTVNTDETLAYSLLANLLKNGIEASGPDQQVTLTLSGGKDIRFTVHNQRTVPEAIRDTFFDKYKTSGKAEGTGLGTYSAKRTAETLGGSIAMTTSEKKGTLITVTLPGNPNDKKD